MSESIVGIVSALKSEASCLMKLRFPLFKIARIAPRTRLCLGGMGGAGALKASQILHEYGVDVLISFGVAAALDDKLIPGDLVLPEATYCKGRKLPVTLEWRERIAEMLPSYLTVVGGTLADTQSPLSSRQEKLKHAEETGACAADMESAIIAEFAAHMDLPFIAIRAIVDPLEFSPPPVLLDAVYADGTVNVVKLVSILVKRSVSFKTLFHLGMGMYAARSTLSKVVETTGLGFRSELTDRSHANELVLEQGEKYMAAESANNNDTVIASSR
ncbi:hopanoid-associated phosphorylase [Nitrosomonas marina]|uniref:Hopanoid-associated phosphorylase n=1 Tax=Nitrosomonas marina TaxID=917 RepID=A0A1I0FUG1_9PROT|nr:phosphorylase [Nitrosomonas marina]SET61209.1 hopanoid-associated phosphorylase [Nitrosomonas marina]